ncbi:hypothetical protein [Paenibacillus crassostreae]|uniref:Uncharacterized protein n=1 Tax=Paenibacillus crassostreae TaxID=1763538 RepID=A0A167G2S1_9BACL|nr:hypothetical protein [Paenibacillus crassostreae]AOZ93817.1 hypothetical protein LPB68_17610 [Paenibacillus crassostreae]OAB77150.1 hypothetical protein PNBC_07125 [Paenibacillus crassostreae]
MSTSKAKKIRQKLEKQGKLNPELMRGSWMGVNPIVRTMPTLKQKVSHLHKKHKRNPGLDSNDSFLYTHFNKILLISS